jgi:glycosyltransferase involved in cell wall biosynthesis
MSYDADGSAPIVIATALREEGITGVHTHVRQLRRYLDGRGTPAVLLTPFSWRRWLTVPVFGFRLALCRISRPAGVAWYRYWHEVFLRQALRRYLATAGPCVVYAQGPEARAALRVRRGPHQRVVMAVHFRTSQADEWVDKNDIARDGAVYRAIRRTEQNTLPRVDGLVYVSDWARRAVQGWIPEAQRVPSAVIGNFVAPLDHEPHPEPQADLVTTGNLDIVKNHRFLLAVLAEARKAGRILTLDVYGEGPCRKSLVQQARDLGLTSQVRFRGFRRDVREFLPGYRAYVHASYSESSSLAIMEAMAAGLPVVAGDIGPLAELCDEGVEGRFWPLDDPARAAAVLLGLLGSEPERAKASAAARERFHRDFDATVVGPRLMQRRHKVKPGITGLWQVSGRSDLPYDEAVRLDVRYVENWSVALDLQILWETCAAVLRGSRAY